MAENKLYDICVRGRLGVWLGLLAILAIIVLAKSLSKDEQTDNSDKQTAGIGIQTGNEPTTTTTTFTTFKAVWSLDPKVIAAENLPAPLNAAFAFEDLPKEVDDVEWDLVHDGCEDDTYNTKRYCTGAILTRS